MTAVEARLAWSEQCVDLCSAILARYDVQSLADPRDRLAAKAADYVAELHSAQLMALRGNHYAAAASQIRLEMEGALSALYLLHLDSKDKASDLEADRAYLPSAKSMWSRCSRLPNIGSKIHTIASAQGPFHKFTHGDMPQINRRSSLGDWKACFNAQEVTVHSILADTLLLATMDTFSHAVRDLQLRVAIRGIRDEVVGQMLAIGIVVPEERTESPAPLR